MTSDEAQQAGDESAAVDSLDDTIWASANSTLIAVDVRPERGAQDLIIHVPPADVVRALRMLRDAPSLGFDYLRCLTAVDNEEDGVDVVYHLYSVSNNINLTVKATLPAADKVIETACGVWRAANWLERETAEMFGIRFTGHPDPRTLLMPEDMTDVFPLLKSHPFAEIEILQGELLGYGRDSGEGGE